MEMHQARYFLAVCEVLSFTRAAEQCHVSQPALTLAIKKLEDEFAGPLFHREGRRVLLTDLGNRIRPHVEQMLSQADAARQVADEFRLLHQAPLQLAVMTTIGPVRLAAFLARFKAEHPGLELGVHEGDLGDLSGRLEAGHLDLGILHAPDGYAPGLRAQPLYRERYVVIVAPGHPLKRQDSINLADVAPYPYVDRLACEMREKVMAVCGEKKIDLYATFRSEREDWVQGMVIAGMGFAFMPEYSVTHGGLVPRPLVEPAVERTVSLVNVAGRPLSPAGQMFARAAQTHRWTG
jgi:DNA-binding transcriptional LysR family regulator